MKTKQFIRCIEALGYKVKEGRVPNRLLITSSDGATTLGIVNKETRYVLSTRFTGFMELSEIDRSDLLDTLENYANTPVPEREEPKRFRLKLFIPALTSNSGGQYLNFDRVTRAYKINNKSETESYQTIFTEDELSGIDETGFMREEVATYEN